MDPQNESIPAPLDEAYGSHEEAFNALKQHSFLFGWGFRKTDSRPRHAVIRTRIYYCCDKVGQYTSKAEVRDTKSRAYNCPFKLVIYQEGVQWKLKVLNKDHNHPPSLDPSTHHIHRRRTPAQKEYIRSRSGTAPKQILIDLRREDPQTLISDQDIRNERASAAAEYLNGRSPLEALLDEFSTPEWVFDVKHDTDNRLECLFFAHKNQVELLHANPDVLLMDCTYRTNKHRLPLLHIVGRTNLGTFFSAGFCFLRTETELDYYWAVSTFLQKTKAPMPSIFLSDQEDALKSAMQRLLPEVPQLLCVWHINKNVQTKAQHVWRNADAQTPEEKEKMKQKRTDFLARWDQVVSAKTELAFYEMWQKLLHDYSSQRELCNYLKEYQYPNRFQWAAAWTSRHQHYGTITTSAAEGKHKVLKDYIRTFQGNLLTVIHQLKEMILTQYKKYIKSLADAKHTIKFNHKPSKMPYLPPGIHDIVTPKAIEHVRQQELLSQKHRENGFNPPCTHSFERIYGLPCYHTINRYKQWGERIPIDQFDNDHWRYQRQTGRDIPLRPFEHIREPLPMPGRGRPRRNESSTRRDPSAFERPVPPTAPQAPQTLAEFLNQISTAQQLVSRPSSSGSSITISIPVTISAPVSAPITISVPVTVSSPSLSPVSVSVPLSISAPVSAPISISAPVTVSSSASSSASSPTPEPALQPDSEPALQPAWIPPTLEEFLADIERQRSEPAFRDWSNAFAFTRHVAETGQQNDPAELIQARHMALDTTGLNECTPEMAWNCFFGDKEAYNREIYRQALARNPLDGSPLPPRPPRVNDALERRLERMRKASRRDIAEEVPIQASSQEEALQEPSLQPVQQPVSPSSPQRPQRATAKRAPTAWAELKPPKRQRRR